MEASERLLRVVVSMLLWLYSITVVGLMGAAMSVLPDRLDPHVFRYLLQLLFIVLGGTLSILCVCQIVWDYVNKGGE